jgi:hypothetical protein
MASSYVEVQSTTVVVCVQGQGVAVVVIIASHCLSLLYSYGTVMFTMLWIQKGNRDIASNCVQPRRHYFCYATELKEGGSMVIGHWSGGLLPSSQPCPNLKISKSSLCTIKTPWLLKNHSV